jgi:hypothetical protein
VGSNKVSGRGQRRRGSDRQARQTPEPTIGSIKRDRSVSLIMCALGGAPKKRPQRGLGTEAVLFPDAIGRLWHPSRRFKDKWATTGRNLTFPLSISPVLSRKGPLGVSKGTIETHNATKLNGVGINRDLGGALGEWLPIDTRRPPSVLIQMAGFLIENQNVSGLAIERGYVSPAMS